MKLELNELAVIADLGMEATVINSPELSPKKTRVKVSHAQLQHYLEELSEIIRVRGYDPIIIYVSGIEELKERKPRAEIICKRCHRVYYGKTCPACLRLLEN